MLFRVRLPASRTPHTWRELLGLSCRLLRSCQLIENVRIVIDRCSLLPKLQRIIRSILAHANARQIFNRVWIVRKELLGLFQSLRGGIILSRFDLESTRFGWRSTQGLPPQSGRSPNMPGSENRLRHAYHRTTSAAWLRSTSPGMLLGRIFSIHCAFLSASG